MTKLFRGDLYIYIIEAKDLPNLDISFFKSKKDVTDPYVTVETCIGGKEKARLAKTRTIDNNLNPRWLEKFEIGLCHELDSIIFVIKDRDLVKAEVVGSVSISAAELEKGEEIEGWFSIEGPVRARKNNGSIKLSIHYISMERMSTSFEVPNCVYPMRTGCAVKMYHNAHCPAIPPVTDVMDRNGEPYKPNQLWIEISEAINKAEKLIYICGWSVKHDIPLIRSGHNDETIGELLLRKADSGVNVLVMVWDEALSNDVYPPGVIGTHDEATYEYFRNTNVQCLKAPRSKQEANALEKQFVTTTFTHHQKCVIVDAPHHPRKKLVAFQGGIDLTDGRWDTFEHPLYRTLFQEHKIDFYNNVCRTTPNVGPRQPWNDIHMYLEGRAAYDILDNFVARWSKLAPDKRNYLYSISSQEFDMEYKNDGEDTWNMQFFRSIDSDSIMFDIEALQHVKTKKGRHYDDSIQKAYIHHIRKAKKYIYIENQYFMGSSYNWKIPHFKCTHLIPMELTLRIIEAIEKKEDFRVYIVIPIHPEGDPTTAPVQEILHWQFRTMEMMYKKIGEAIKKEKLVNAHPTDYLSFFCLTKRDSALTLPEGLAPAPPNTPADACRRSFKFMIYNHSKMAIFDDEYVIIGSANINQRSMDGKRDSEMCFGAYQPNFGDNGDVRAFRLAVWAAHCGKHMEEHLNPSSIQCMEAMKWLGQENLTEYLKPNPFSSDSHLMSYPLYVEKDGDLDALHDCKAFPVTGGSIKGKSSLFLPNRLTT